MQHVKDIGVPLAARGPTEVVLVERLAYEGSDERVRRIASVCKRSFWVQPASVGYHACSAISCLDNFGQRHWRLTRAGAIRKLATMVGEQMFDDYVPERAE